jgi:hypothetical protein
MSTFPLDRRLSGSVSYSSGYAGGKKSKLSIVYLGGTFQSEDRG